MQDRLTCKGCIHVPDCCSPEHWDVKPEYMDRCEDYQSELDGYPTGTVDDEVLYPTDGTWQEQADYLDELRADDNR